jgi:hypothetical protein
VAHECLRHSKAKRERVADGVRMSLNRNHSGSLRFAPMTISRTNDPRESAAFTRIGGRSQLLNVERSEFSPRCCAPMTVAPTVLRKQSGETS